MTSPYTVQVAQSLREIDAAQWDACANPQADGQAPDPHGDESHEAERFNPFISHAFLRALETSKSIGPRTGWTSTHLLVKDTDGRLAAAAPAYLKTHSMGEYVFDHGWADAYHRAGLHYYPKLQVAVPFTPVTGRRLLVAPGHGEAARSALLGGLRAWREKIEASSIHITFPTRTEWEALGASGFLQRTGQQFHFLNQGYADFEAFLSDLASRKRKVIRRERKEALADGITIELLTGADIKEIHWDAFFHFYMDTGERKWGTPYLSRAFFSLAGAAMSEYILLVMAKRKGRYIAGALNFIGKDALYGRNWGAIEEHPFLHFEVCYYQAIAFAIARGLSRVEAGAQGEHKLARGYRAVATFSAHDIGDKRFARAIEDYLQRERVHIDEAMREYEELAPFKKVP
ncbi:GNAT family N-acetyltransferase [Methylocapsa sp. D3K7]|uniref:GNAT family N-acetyltransferase n=1 Tax=Methylocapsa sp. D3K7 TaxID=3041435 RepID=UPI00244E6411|nr:GNAT family N-acetyltransferase [Methylocapsa sp. D3K7]WGJ15442.1 GNAT family N-acetyltransferase [Methylocapsa sp. D3K7]